MTYAFNSEIRTYIILSNSMLFIPNGCFFFFHCSSMIHIALAINPSKW